MFGRREVAELRARVEGLEQQLRRADRANAAARALLDDACRLENLAERAAASRAAAEAAVEGLRSTAVGSASGSPRFRPKVNIVYRAETTGYVTLTLKYGWASNRLRVMVGPEDPPTDCVCEVSTEIWYGSAIIRPGEYWTVASNNVEDGRFGCLFAPLF